MGNIYLEYTFVNGDHMHEHKDHINRNESNLSARWFGQDAFYAYAHNFFSGCGWEWDDEFDIDKNMDSLEGFVSMMRIFAQKCKMLDLNLEDSNEEESEKNNDEPAWDCGNPCGTEGSGADNTATGTQPVPVKQGHEVSSMAFSADKPVSYDDLYDLKVENAILRIELREAEKKNASLQAALKIFVYGDVLMGEDVTTKKRIRLYLNSRRLTTMMVSCI